MATTTKLISPVNLIVLAFIVTLFAYLISGFGEDLADNSKASLSTSSQIYIADMTGGDTVAGLNVSQTDSTLVPGALDDDEAENRYDFALDFVFGKKKSNSLSRFAYIVLSIPEFVISDVFGLAKNDFKFVVDLLDWLWRLFIFSAIVATIRNRTS